MQKKGDPFLRDLPHLSLVFLISFIVRLFFQERFYFLPVFSPFWILSSCSFYFSLPGPFSAFFKFFSIFHPFNCIDCFCLGPFSSPFAKLFWYLSPFSCLDWFGKLSLIFTSLLTRLDIILDNLDWQAFLFLPLHLQYTVLSHNEKRSVQSGLLSGKCAFCLLKVPESFQKQLQEQPQSSFRSSPLNKCNCRHLYEKMHTVCLQTEQKKCRRQRICGKREIVVRKEFNNTFPSLLYIENLKER